MATHKQIKHRVPFTSNDLELLASALRAVHTVTDSVLISSGNEELVSMRIDMLILMRGIEGVLGNIQEGRKKPEYIPVADEDRIRSAPTGPITAARLGLSYEDAVKQEDFDEEAFMKEMDALSAEVAASKVAKDAAAKVAVSTDVSTSTDVSNEESTTSESISNSRIKEYPSSGENKPDSIMDQF